MYRKIVVGLDLSPLSEQSLGLAGSLAALSGAKLVLVHLLFIQQDLSDLFNELVEQAQRYLDDLKAILTSDKSSLPFQLKPQQVETRLLFDRYAAQLGEVAREEGADLLVMTSRGEAGFSRRALGNVSSQVLHQLHKTGGPSLLLVKACPNPPRANRWGATFEPIASYPAGSTQKTPGTIGPVVVLVDGNRRLETILEPALELAANLKAPLHLVDIVSRPTREIFKSSATLAEIAPVSPGKSGTRLAQLSLQSIPETTAGYIKRAEDYLTELKERLLADPKSQGLTITTVIRFGSRTMQIASYAGEVQAAALALAVPQHSVLVEMLFGNIACETLQLTPLPLLVCASEEPN